MPTPPAASDPLAWFRQAPPDAKRALAAACLGWMLDSFDVNLYALVLASVMSDLALSKATAGLIGSLTLVTAAVGGVLFGLAADRFGRTRALTGSILVYSVCTGACGLAQNAWQLGACRALLGLGMGGEWAAGAALVSETWPDEHRGKALGVVQSAWAIGYAAAAVVAQVMLRWGGWRAVFFVGVLPALVTAWVLRRVREPDVWRTATASHSRVERRAGLAIMLRGPMLRLTIFVTLMNACTLYAYWAFTQWVPAYLELPPSHGGLGLAHVKTVLLVAMNIGMWFGYIAFGLISDRLGRKRTYVTYVLAAAALVLAFGSVRVPAALFALLPFVGFFGAGYFSGFGAVTAEIYPTSIRASAQGLTYNLGRVVSAAAPWTVGALATAHGFTAAFATAAAAFLLAAVAWIWIPETRGRRLA